MVGAAMVMPGGKLDGASIYELLDTYRVTFTAGGADGVADAAAHLETNNLKLPYLKKRRDRRLGLSARHDRRNSRTTTASRSCHAWGMTEMSPLGTLGSLKPEYAGLNGEARLDVQQKQGHAPFGVEMKITDDAGKACRATARPSAGSKCAGPAVARPISRTTARRLDDEGFFDTGDVGTIDAYGYLNITDRSKDVIKSGGEWISSIELENLAVGHPKVAEAAVIGVRHPKWDERPLLVIVLKAGQERRASEEMLAYLDGKVAKWWMPDDVVFVAEIPHTATGKIQKTVLREQFKNHVLPTAAA